MSDKEKDPSLTLNMGDGTKMELTHRNTTLYTFLGKTAIGDLVFDNASANHVFVRTGHNEQNQPRGLYFFERFQPVYGDIARFAVEHSLPQILNMHTVPECDMKAYMSEVDREEAKFHASLEGVLPEDFTT
jgi:hypothetical protein